MREVVLAPSDFAFLFAGCPRCAWLKLARGARPPRQDFPGIFAKIDAAAKRHLSTRADWERLGLPGRVPLPFRGRLRSAPVPFPDLGVALVVQGIPDVLLALDEGGIEVNDLKTSATGELGKYVNQLSGYAYAIANPDDPVKLEAALGGALHDPRRVSALCWNPEAMVAGADGTNAAHLVGAWSYREWPYSENVFLAYLEGVARLAARGDAPEPGKCDRCAYVARTYGVGFDAREEYAVPSEPPSAPREAAAPIVPYDSPVRRARTSAPAVRRTTRGYGR